MNIVAVTHRHWGCGQHQRASGGCVSGRVGSCWLLIDYLSATRRLQVGFLSVTRPLPIGYPWVSCRFQIDVEPNQNLGSQGPSTQGILDHLSATCRATLLTFDYLEHSTPCETKNVRNILILFCFILELMRIASRSVTCQLPVCYLWVTCR